jgi:type VI secretion system protein VasJ
LFKSLLNPINTISPCGTDAKYDDIYLTMETEIDKMNSIFEGSQTNWEFVNNECINLIENQTKDIKLLAWLAFSQYKLNGITGFQNSIQIINQLLENFGKELFPKSTKAKLGALSWLDTVLNHEIIQDRQIIVPLNDVDSLLNTLHDFQIRVSDVCENDDQLFKEICRLLEIKVSEKRQQDESNKPKTAQASTTIAENTLDGDITSDAEAIKVLNQMKKSAEHLAQYWRQQQPDDVRAIRLTRMMSWLEIDGLPLVQQGKTMINPPSSARIEQLDTLLQEGKNIEALEIIESLIFRSPFWFDGHYKAYQICESMQKDNAALEIKNLLLSFINSNEGIMKLNFRDSTPFIPADMNGWLSEQTGAIAPSDVKEIESDLSLIANQCYELVNKKNAKEAMEILQQSFMEAKTKEKKFQWRLLHAQVALAAGKPLMTTALIEELEREIENYRLEEWQPELVAEVYRFYLNSFNRTQIDRDKYDVAFQRLCRVDMAAAIDIK